MWCDELEMKDERTRTKVETFTPLTKIQENSFQIHKYYTTYTGKKVLVIKEYSFSFSTYNFEVPLLLGASLRER